MPASSPATTLRTEVIAALTTEFGAEIPVRGDKLHPAMLGPVAGVYPVSESEGARVLDQISVVAVQVYLRWDPQVDPAQQVDPSNIEIYAQRLRNAIYTHTHPYAGSRELWDIRVLRVEYEEDPTGNVTRFVAYVQGQGQNFAETSAA